MGIQALCCCATVGPRSSVAFGLRGAGEIPVCGSHASVGGIFALTLPEARSTVAKIFPSGTSELRRKQHGQTHIPVAVVGPSISGTGRERAGIEKNFEDHDEKFVGDRRPDPRLVCVRTCARFVGRWPRSSDIPDGSRDLSYA